MTLPGAAGPTGGPSQSSLEVNQPFLALSAISKRYGGVRALDRVDFSCRRGEIHAVLGENGAGKSTLIKIIAGVVPPDDGAIALEGKPVRFAEPAAATAQGIVSVFQELSLLPDLTVADNITLAAPPRRFGLIDARAQRRRAEALLARIGCEDVNPAARIRDLPLSRRQMVEIAKALGKNPRLLVLDEATSALTQADVARIYRLLERLRQEEVAILFISHRMHEVEALADLCSVFRNGRHVRTFAKGALGNDAIVELMIGREISGQYPPKPPPRINPAVLTVEHLRWQDRLKDISLSIGRGEIVGLGGLDGQGQKELLLALFGVLRGVSGTIRVDGRKIAPASPAAAKRSAPGIALIPEDRKTEGLMLAMSVADNLTAAALERIARGPFIDPRKKARVVADGIKRLGIRVGAPEDAVSTLSGGNQQKVVIAKWLMTEPGIILLNDPTRGIDVGTKQELYRLLRELAERGAAILFYSTDYDELIGCCDRVAVMYDGHVVRELAGTEITEQAIVASALALGAAHTGVPEAMA